MLVIKVILDLHLIEELEMSQMVALNTHVESLRARLEVMKKEEKRDWTELLQEFARTGSRATLLKTLCSAPSPRTSRRMSTT